MKRLFTKSFLKRLILDRERDTHTETETEWGGAEVGGERALSRLHGECRPRHGA